MTNPRLTCLPAALAAIALAASCGSPATSAGTPQPTASPRPSIPVATATPNRVSDLPSPVVTAREGVAAAVGVTVLTGAPKLVPAYIPSGMTATVRATPQSYTVQYTDDLHTREIGFQVNVGSNPPPVTGPNGSSTHIQFRGVRTQYTVYDTTAPLSQRYLLWPDVKGTPEGVGPPGVGYFLSSTGLTEAEFFRVANSLQPV